MRGEGDPRARASGDDGARATVRMNLDDGRAHAVTTRTVETETVEVEERPVRAVTRRVVDRVRAPRAMGAEPVPAPRTIDENSIETRTRGRLATLAGAEDRVVRAVGSPGVGEVAPQDLAVARAMNARTSVTYKRYEDMDVEEKLETSEKRLFETQATLVREAMKREVTENILRETAKSLSAVRKASLQGQSVETTGGAIPGSVEHQNGILMQRVRELTEKMQSLSAIHQEKESELQSVRRLLQQRENEFDLIGERPVSINLEIKEFTDEGQFELIEQTRTVLSQAQEQAQAVSKLRQLDRQRTRALGDLVLTMEARRKELQEKLKDAGVAEYDDDRVAAAGGEGYDAANSGVVYDGPLTSPSGKSFYVTRTATFWDRFFGIQI